MNNFHNRLPRRNLKKSKKKIASSSFSNSSSSSSSSSLSSISLSSKKIASSNTSSSFSLEAIHKKKYFDFEYDCIHAVIGHCVECYNKAKAK